MDLWKLNVRFQEHDDIDNRKLLWHGTNIAVVAAILKAGLRIMPHSGGLVGRGIYFASEHAKSSWYGEYHIVYFHCLCCVLVTYDIHRIIFISVIKVGRDEKIKGIHQGKVTLPTTCNYLVVVYRA